MTNTVILLRADSGFSNTALIDLCNELGIYYLIGLAKNKALIKRLENWDPEFIKVLRQPESIGDVLSHIGEIRDYKAQSWTGPRRVIVRDFWNDVRREWDVLVSEGLCLADNDVRDKIITVLCVSDIHAVCTPFIGSLCGKLLTGTNTPFAMSSARMAAFLASISAFFRFLILSSYRFCAPLAFRFK